MGYIKAKADYALSIFLKGSPSQIYAKDDYGIYKFTRYPIQDD